MIDTRQQILEKNFEAIHKFGFQGVRTDKVVVEMGITKGALYHYFPSKFDLGYAIVDEIIAPQYTSLWKSFGQVSENHAQILVETVQKYLFFCQNEAQFLLGCPLTNLTQEMSPLDEGFRNRLNYITTTMQSQIEAGLKNGQMKGAFRADFNPMQVSMFILATIEGAFSISKAMQTKVTFEMIINQLTLFAQSLGK